MADCCLPFYSNHLPPHKHPFSSLISDVQQYTSYHLEMYTITNRFDYAGINLLISGSAFPPLYYGMYCQIAVATIYLSVSLLIATFCFIVCLF